MARRRAFLKVRRAMDTLKMLTLAVAILLGRLVEPDGENTPGVSPQLTGGELSSVQAVTATLGSLEPSASLQIAEKHAS